MERQDGHEVADDRILVDLGMISGPVHVSLLEVTMRRKPFYF